MMNKEISKEEVLEITLKEIRKQLMKFNITFGLNEGYIGRIEDTLSKDLISHLQHKISTRREEIRADYDMKTLPIDNFTYPDYKNEEKLYDYIVDNLPNPNDNLYVYIIETNKSLYQIRHLILWNIACIKHEFGISLKDERKTLLMATDAIIDHNMYGMYKHDSNRKDRLLTYSKNSATVPEVQQFLEQTGLNILIED